MYDSVWPQRRGPTRLPHPWDSPGKNARVGCQCLLHCMKVESESEIAQSCPTPSDPMDCSLPGPPSMGFSRQEYWSGLPLSSPFIKLSWIKGQAWGWQSAGLGYYFSWSSINGVSQVVQWETIHLPMQEMQEMQFDPWDGKIPWSRNWQSTPVFLPEKSHKKRSRLQSMELKKVRHNWAHTHTELKQMAHLPNSQNKLIQNRFVEWK